MIKVALISVFTCACLFSRAQVNIITTIAGKDTAGYSGDNGPATNAKLYWPCSICLDTSGSIFFADAANSRIRKIDPTTGTITTVAGTNIAGYNGDNIQATDAELAIPSSVFCDVSGNVYIADGLNHRVRKIARSTNIITTIAGRGTAGYSGDGSAATNAELNAPTGVTVDIAGNVFIADLHNNRVRRVDFITGTISTIAGTGIAGYSGDGGSATNAKISDPCQAFADSHGNVFFTESGNSTIRKISVSTGIITTIAGTGSPGYSGIGGPAVSAKLSKPYGIFIDSVDNIFVDNWGSGTICKIDAVTKIITTVAGTGVQGFSGDGGPATDAKLRPDGVFVDKFGTIYIADIDNERIRMVYNPKLFTPQQPAPSPLITIYPNPTQNELTIEYQFTSGEDGDFQITDLAGRVVATKVLTHQKEKETINIAALSPGLYLYKVVQSNALISTGKIVKE